MSGWDFVSGLLFGVNVGLYAYSPHRCFVSAGVAAYMLYVLLVRMVARP